MGKKGGAIQVSISVQSELKARMAKENVNWSAVAAAAFETKLAEISANKLGSKNMTGLITRLKASTQLKRKKTAVDGKELGRKWVLERVTSIDQIRKLESLRDLVGHDAYQITLDSEVLLLGAGLCDIVADDEEYFSMRKLEDYEVFEEYGITRERLRDCDFVDSFLEGALEVCTEAWAMMTEDEL